MLRFLHLADLHLGAAFDMLSQKAAESAQQKQFAALEHAVRVAGRERAHAILIAGDLFDSPLPSATVFSRAMSILSQAACPVLIAPGNHDHICAGSPYLTSALPSNVHVFTQSTLEPVHLGEAATVWGAAFHDQSAVIPLTHRKFSRPVNICLVHTDLKTDGGYNHYSPDEIAASGFSYLAAGHNHAPSGLRRAGGTVFCCPGGMSAVASTETGRKGFLRIEIGETIKAQFIESKAVEFSRIEIDLTPIPSDTGLQKVLIERIPKNHDRVCATVALVGERIYKPNLTALRRVLGQVFLSCEVVDETVPKKPVWRYLQQDDLRGAVSRRYRDLIEASNSSEEKEALMLALRYALAAFDDDPRPQA